MFFTVMKYRMKYMLTNKVDLFWLILWPFILATLFSFAFSNLLSQDEFTNIEVSIVNGQNDTRFVDAMHETGIFNISADDLQTAQNKLTDEKITGYIVVGDDIEAYVKGSGINETIIKNALDKYLQIKQSYTNLIKGNPEILKTQFLKEFRMDTDYTRNVTSKNNNPIVIYFYTIIAMCATMSATRGIDDICSIQANQTAVGARVSVAPVKKVVVYFAHFTVSLLVNVLALILVFLYMRFVLNVDFCNQFGYMLMVGILGTIASLFVGTLIGTLKLKYTVKVSIGIIYSLFGCFLSGMMNGQIKCYIQTHLPVLAYINPSNLVTDGLYSLYYYGISDRYWANVAVLTVMSVVTGIATLVILRRQKYASI